MGAHHAVLERTTFSEANGGAVRGHEWLRAFVILCSRKLHHNIVHLHESRSENTEITYNMTREFCRKAKVRGQNPNTYPVMADTVQTPKLISTAACIVGPSFPLMHAAFTLQRPNYWHSG